MRFLSSAAAALLCLLIDHSYAIKGGTRRRAPNEDVRQAATKNDQNTRSKRNKPTGKSRSNSNRELATKKCKTTAYGGSSSNPCDNSLSNTKFWRPIPIPSSDDSKEESLFYPSQEPIDVATSTLSEEATTSTQSTTLRSEPTATNNPTTVPSKIPIGFTTTTVSVRETGRTYQQYECEEIPPEGSTKSQNVEVEFQYFLYLQPQTREIAQIVEAIEVNVAEKMAMVTMPCNYDENTEKSIQTLKIAPALGAKKRTEECPEEYVRKEADCYIVSAGFATTVFYITNDVAIIAALPRKGDRKDVDGGVVLPIDEDLAVTMDAKKENNGSNRYLAQSQIQQDLYRLYGSLLADIFGSGLFSTLPLEETIVDTEFRGFVAKDLSADFSGIGVGQSTDGISSIMGGGMSIPSANDPGFIIGVLTICVAATCFIIFIFFLCAKQRATTMNMKGSVEEETAMGDKEQKIVKKEADNVSNTRSEGGGTVDRPPAIIVNDIDDTNLDEPMIIKLSKGMKCREESFHQPTFIYVQDQKARRTINTSRNGEKVAQFTAI